MPLVAVGFGLFFASCDLAFRAFGVVDGKLLGGAVLDTLFGPQESFEYSSTTSPGPPPPLR